MTHTSWTARHLEAAVGEHRRSVGKLPGPVENVFSPFFAPTRSYAPDSFVSKSRAAKMPKRWGPVEADSESCNSLLARYLSNQ